MKLLVTICFVFSASLVESFSRYDGDQVWSFIPKNEDQLNFIKSLTSSSHYNFDVWKDPTRLGKKVDFKVLSKDVTSLQQLMTSHRMMYEVKIEDVQVLVDKERKDRKAKSTKPKSLDEFDYSVYHTAEEIYEWMDLVTSKYSFVTKVRVGATFEGRPIYALEFKNNSFPDKPAIYIDALIHCREWITPATTMYTFHQMLTNPELQGMFNDFDWFYIPMINVDGYIYTWEENRLWRKTRSTTATSRCTGVDANRNWDVAWSEPGAEKELCSIFYHGPFAHSEPEVRHLAHYIMEKRGSIKVALTIHSYSQLILYPYNYEEGTYPPNSAELDALAGNMSKAMFDVHQKEYVYGPGAETIYVASGVTSDWTYEKAGIDLSYTFELRDTGEYGFILPADQIIPNGEEFLAGIKAMVDMLREHEGSG